MRRAQPSRRRNRGPPPKGACTSAGAPSYFDPELPAYNLVNLRAGLIRESWELPVFLNNVTDEVALLGLDRERGTRARAGYLTNQPRTGGVTLRFNY